MKWLQLQPLSFVICAHSKTPRQLRQRLQQAIMELQKPAIEKEFVAIVMQKTLHQISDIDFSAPVTENQQTSEQLRHQQALHLYNEVAAAAALVIRYLRTL